MADGGVLEEVLAWKRPGLRQIAAPEGLARGVQDGLVSGACLCLHAACWCAALIIDSGHAGNFAAAYAVIPGSGSLLCPTIISAQASQGQNVRLADVLPIHRRQ